MQAIRAIRCSQTLYTGRTEGCEGDGEAVSARARGAEAHRAVEQFAGELGVSRGAVAQWEMTDGTSPSVENLIALARRSGMAFEYLSTGRGTKVHGKPIITASEDHRIQQDLTPQQQRLLTVFDGLTPKQRSGLLDLLDSSVAQSHARLRG